MSKYRSTSAEKVAAAQAIQNRVNGVAAVQPAREKVESVAEFVARGGVVQVLPNNFDGFITDYLAVPYA